MKLKPIQKKTAHKKCKCEKPEIGVHTLYLRGTQQVDFVYTRCNTCFTVMQYERPSTSSASVVDMNIRAVAAKKEPVVKTPVEKIPMPSEPEAVEIQEAVIVEPVNSIDEFESRQPARKTLKIQNELISEDIEALRKQAEAEDAREAELEKAYEYLSNQDNTTEMIEEREDKFEIVQVERTKLNAMDVGQNALRFICKTSRTERYFTIIRKADFTKTPDMDLSKLLGKVLRVRYNKVTPDGLPYEGAAVGFA